MEKRERQSIGYESEKSVGRVPGQDVETDAVHIKSGIMAEFVKYVTLNVLGMLGLSCYILADTFFISKGLGARGLTALNLAIPMYSFIHGSGLMIGMGAGTRYSIYRSQKQEQKANRTFTTAVYLAAIFAIVFVSIGLFGSGKVATLLGADESVWEMTEIYLRVILLFSPAYLMNNVLLCFVRNDGAPNISMAAMLGGSFSNVILDYIFIFPMQMGIFGAVLATGFAPLISMSILSPHFLRKKNQFHLVRCGIKWKRISGILLSGIPSLITELASGIVIIIFNIIILDLAGNTGVAAYGVIANLSLVIVSIYTGIAQGMQPIMSSHYGAGRNAAVKKILKYGVVTTMVLSALLYIGIFFGAAQITGIFNSEGDTVLQKIAEEGLKLYFLACPFAGFNIVISVYFTSVEHPIPANLISVLRGFVVIIPLAFLMAAMAGIVGVWCVFPVTEVLVSMIAVGVYWKMKRG